MPYQNILKNCFYTFQIMTYFFMEELIMKNQLYLFGGGQKPGYNPPPHSHIATINMTVAIMCLFSVKL